MRVAVEFRHRRGSWIGSAYILHRHNASLVWADRGGRLQNPDWITADWLYLRLHGGRGTPAITGSTVIDAYAHRLSKLDRDAYVYFNNDDDRQRGSERARALGARLRSCAPRRAKSGTAGYTLFNSLIHQTHTRRTAMRIACLLDSDFEDSEFRKPYDAFKAAGHEVVIIGLQRDCQAHR